MPHATRHCMTHLLAHIIPSSHTSLLCLCINVFLSVCVSFPVFDKKKYEMSPRPFARPCAARVFINILRPSAAHFFLLHLYLFSILCFCCFIFVFLTHFSGLCLCFFLCAFCVALTARAINFNCAFYAPTHPVSIFLSLSYSTPLTHSLCCLLFCFIMQKKSAAAAFSALFTGLVSFLRATPRLTLWWKILISFYLFSGTPIFLFFYLGSCFFALRVLATFLRVARQWGRDYGYGRGAACRFRAAQSQWFAGASTGARIERNGTKANSNWTLRDNSNNSNKKCYRGNNSNFHCRNKLQFVAVEPPGAAGTSAAASARKLPRQLTGDYLCLWQHRVATKW